jgi:NADPH-dependent curcumin reductase
MNDNVQWCLRTRPNGEVRREDFEIRRSERPVPCDGQVLVRNIYLLVPASMRIWMNEKESYFPPQPLGQVMAGITLGVVETSNSASLPVGTYVNGMGGWQHWFVAPAEHLQPVAPNPSLPLAAYRSVLDVQGLTAYCGLTDIGKPVTGETLVVTAAAGVGSLVCQIGKKLDLRVIGIAGSADKGRWLLDECGVDGVIDYKQDDVAAQLDALCPKGVDILFENVGGPVMDKVIDRINYRGRVALCGLVSTYNGDIGQSVTSLMQLVNKSARMEGFLVTNYMSRYREVIGKLEAWALDGSLKYQIDILDGLDSVIDAMSRLFHGRNRGVQLVRITPE